MVLYYGYIVYLETIIMTKLTNKQKRGVKRRVDLEQGVRPPNSSVFVNKKKYNRKQKHKKNEEKDILGG